MVARAAGLDIIHHPAVNLALWRRPEAERPGAEVAAWLAARAAGPVGVREAVLALSPESVDAFLGDEAPHAGRDWLANDLLALGVRFGRVMQTSAVRMQLAVVANDRCQRFHADSVTVRGLCTYVGPGTEWLEEYALDRAAAAPSTEGLSTAESNRRIVADPRGLHAVRRGSFALLKGSAYPGNAAWGLVHRSPQVAAKGLRRLVVKLDVPR